MNNPLKSYISVVVLIVEDLVHGALQEELLITPLTEGFKTSTLIVPKYPNLPGQMLKELHFCIWFAHTRFCAY